MKERADVHVNDGKVFPFLDLRYRWCFVKHVSSLHEMGYAYAIIYVIPHLSLFLSFPFHSFFISPLPSISNHPPTLFLFIQIPITHLSTSTTHYLPPPKLEPHTYQTPAPALHTRTSCFTHRPPSFLAGAVDNDRKYEA